MLNGENNFKTPNNIIAHCKLTSEDSQVNISYIRIMIGMIFILAMAFSIRLERLGVKQLW